ncbi:MAG TPA: helix-turn-helix domain-containing protein [Pyrinomonadaceae bacterium]|jgi:cytoskeletal protein RodZ|nr:helix-turn-helix domain-containing protein [Pyrinomonadaceae bacterium]
MSLTLGEKLRQAREDKGLSLSEVAEQTRISSLYLESIENDDYRILPGGIFNKGFVKSYAKFVGIGEQEALTDYSALLAANEAAQPDGMKVYKPEVLTDDRSTGMIPTLIVAAVVLAIMTAGILYLVNYLRSPENPATANSPRPAANAPNDTPAANVSEQPDAGVPSMATLSVELKAVSQPVKVIVTADGELAKPLNIVGGGSTTLSPKDTLTLNYIRWNATALQMTINGKQINLPAEPLDPKDKERIIFTISKDNLAQIWTSGSIGNSTVVPADANVAAPATTVPQRPAATPATKPSVATNTTGTNTAAKPTPVANTAKPPTMMTAKPTPKPPVP